MKKFICVLLCLILAGCVAKGDLSSELDAIFANESNEFDYRCNNYSTYYDFYLPSDTCTYTSDALSSVFTYNRSYLIMDLNIAGIVNARYYPDNVIEDEGFFDPAKQVYARDGIYVNGDDEYRSYIYRVYAYNDQYLAYFASRDLVFYGYTNESDIVPLTSRILLLARTTWVREDEVIARYSAKDVIDYEKKQVNMFETIMPVNGNINDFLLDHNDSGDTE